MSESNFCVVRDIVPFFPVTVPKPCARQNHSTKLREMEKTLVIMATVIVDPPRGWNGQCRIDYAFNHPLPMIFCNTLQSNMDES